VLKLRMSSITMDSDSLSEFRFVGRKKTTLKQQLAAQKRRKRESSHRCDVFDQRHARLRDFRQSP
jgi:hypothetical protein